MASIWVDEIGLLFDDVGIIVCDECPCQESDPCPPGCYAIELFDVSTAGSPDVTSVTLSPSESICEGDTFTIQWTIAAQSNNVGFRFSSIGEVGDQSFEYVSHSPAIGVGGQFSENEDGEIVIRWGTGVTSTSFEVVVRCLKPCTVDESGKRFIVSSDDVAPASYQEYRLLCCDTES